MINSIYEFNTKLLGVKTGKPNLLTDAEHSWLVMALQEEIEELEEARTNESVVDCVDSLLDLAYFAIGGCVRLGLTADRIQECFETIHNANMAKKMGVKQTRPQDGTVADAVKPAGWQSPEQTMFHIIFRPNTQLELPL